VAYITSQGERLLAGVVRIGGGAGASGILCACCRAVISCSQFEAHAGRGSRRAPYDNIFTAAGDSLRRVAMLMPAAEAEEPAHYRAARGAGAAPAGARCAAAVAPRIFFRTSGRPERAARCSRTLVPRSQTLSFQENGAKRVFFLLQQKSKNTADKW